MVIFRMLTHKNKMRPHFCGLFFFCTENQKNKEKKANKKNFILHIRYMETNMLFRVSKSAVGTRYRNHSAKTMYESLEN